MLMKLDGSEIDLTKGLKSEDDFFGVQLRYNRFIDKVQIDVNVTPLYCKTCDKQLPYLYAHRGSRYGYVGSVECDYCGKSIIVSDSDNIVEFLRSDMYFDYYKLYLLEDQVWKKIKEKTGLNIFQKDYEDYFTLTDITYEICKISGLKLTNIENHGIVTDEKIKRLPKVVNRWLALLKQLQII